MFAAKDKGTEISESELFSSSLKHDKSMIEFLTNVFELSIANNPNYDIQCECNHTRDTYIINISFYERNHETDKFSRRYIFKLDLSSYRVTVFTVCTTELREFIAKDTRRFNFLTKTGKALFAELFMKYYTNYTVPFEDDAAISYNTLKDNHGVIKDLYNELVFNERIALRRYMYGYGSND